MNVLLCVSVTSNRLNSQLILYYTKLYCTVLYIIRKGDQDDKGRDTGMVPKSHFPSS